MTPEREAAIRAAIASWTANTKQERVTRDLLVALDATRASVAALRTAAAAAYETYTRAGATSDAHWSAMQALGRLLAREEHHGD